MSEPLPVVRFWSLPVGAIILHRGTEYRKVSICDMEMEWMPGTYWFMIPWAWVDVVSLPDKCSKCGQNLPTFDGKYRTKCIQCGAQRLLKS